MMKRVVLPVAVVSALLLTPLLARAADLHADAAAALKRAVAYYHGSVASHGGYVYYYSLDLKSRWGEGKASEDLLFVQPPGTPTVGLAYLRAYEATNDPACLAAARDAARCLVDGQLVSGGWAQVIYFGSAPSANRVGKYVTRRGGNWNQSSLDDGQTQAALRLLIEYDKAADFKDAAIHDAARYGLDALTKAQFANGAFPQGWQGPSPAKPADLRAKYPDYDWRTEGRVKNYWDHYTLNDGLAGTVADTLTLAHATYKDAKYLAALKKLGDFLVLAQMPDPQPAWCQQYNYDMVPIWARKFEPPAITGWESQDAMRTLIRIATITGDKRYLEPIPRALAYFKKVLLPDGRVARYYELKTDNPLYMDARYQLTYDDSAAPSHYGWKQDARFDEIEKAYEAALAGKAEPAAPRTPNDADARKILAALDKDGRWVSTYAGERLVGQPKFAEGFKYLDSGVFSRNVETLSAYLQAK